VCVDTGQRGGGNPPIPHRLIGAFFPMLGYSKENRLRVKSGRLLLTPLEF
jgi:hypothetical protein